MQCVFKYFRVLYINAVLYIKPGVNFFFEGQHFYKGFSNNYSTFLLWSLWNLCNKCLKELEIDLALKAKCNFSTWSSKWNWVPLWSVDTWTWGVDVQMGFHKSQRVAELCLTTFGASTQEKSKKSYQHIQINIYHPLTLHRLRCACRTHTHPSKFAEISVTDNRILHCKFLLYFYNPGMTVSPKFLAYTGWAELTNCCLQIWSALPKDHEFALKWNPNFK